MKTTVTNTTISATVTVITAIATVNSITIKTTVTHTKIATVTIVRSEIREPILCLLKSQFF